MNKWKDYSSQSNLSESSKSKGRAAISGGAYTNPEAVPFCARRSACWDRPQNGRRSRVLPAAAAAARVLTLRAIWSRAPPQQCWAPTATRCRPHWATHSGSAAASQTLDCQRGELLWRLRLTHDFHVVGTGVRGGKRAALRQRGRVGGEEDGRARHRRVGRRLEQTLYLRHHHRDRVRVRKAGHVCSQRRRACWLPLCCPGAKKYQLNLQCYVIEK